MFSDTHFHFQNMTQQCHINGTEILEKMAARNCCFGLDIGTKSDDLQARQSVIEQSISEISDSSLADKVRNFIYFSAGIWPAVDDIHDRFNRMKILEDCIKKAAEDSDQDTLHRKIVAVGECGLDHHWNPSGEDGRCENDFDEKTYRGERELFELQLELGRSLNLPVIIHSRDAFEDTLDCIKNVGYDNGIIHCYSYGLAEARAFLDRGWYISFSGSITYTKKSKMEDMLELLRFVPEDRILCETDSPYLAPVPYRGQKNTPYFVEEVYKFAASARAITPEQLSEIVDKNILQLFKI